MSKKPGKPKKDFMNGTDKESAPVDSGTKGKSTSKAGFTPASIESAEKAVVEANDKSDNSSTAQSAPGSELPIPEPVKKYSVIKVGVGAKVSSGLGTGVSAVGTSITLPGAGGVNVSLADNRSNIPDVVTTQPGRRNDRITFPDASKLNSVASEQAIQETIQQPRINENPGEPQGYNGIDDVQFRSRKIDGATALNWLDNKFYRSMDYMFTDRIVHTCGQVLEKASLIDVYPLQTYNPSTKAWENVASRPVRGNYMLRGIKITLNGKDYLANGHVIKGVEFVTEEFPAYHEYLDPSILDTACVEADIDLQTIAKVDWPNLTHLGDITDPARYIPLGNGIPEAIEFNTLLRDIEMVDGSILCHAVGTLDTAWANVVSMREKFGNDSRMHRNFVLNPIEAGVYGQSQVSDITYDSAFDPFGAQAYQDASLSLLISIFDSPAKYNTVADLVMQARSPKNVLGDAVLVMDEFMIKPEFKKVLDYNRAIGFSTDSYDGVTPVLYTRNIGLMIPFDPTKLATWSAADGQFKSIYNYAFQVMHGYDVGRAIIPAFMQGVGKWLVDFSGKLKSIFSISTGVDTDKVIFIPLNFNNLKPDLGSSIICAGAKHMLNQRLDTMHDVIRASESGRLGKYPYSQLRPLKEFSPLSHKGFSTSNIMLRDGSARVVVHGMELSPLSKEQKILFTDPEQIWNFAYYEDNGTDYICVLQPWYMSASNFSVTDDVWENDETMNWFVTRSVAVRESLADLIEMGPNKYRKLKDIAVVPYGARRVSELVDYVAGATDGIAATWFKDGDDTGKAIDGGSAASLLQLRVEEVLCNVREFGWHFPCPPGYLERRCITANGVDAYAATGDSEIKDLSTMSVMTFQGSLPAGSFGTAFRQIYRRLWAHAPADTQATFGSDTGLFMSMGALLGVAGEIDVVPDKHGNSYTSRKYYPYVATKQLFSCALLDIFEPGIVVDTAAIGDQTDEVDYYLLDDAIAHGFTGMEPSDFSMEKDGERDRRQSAVRGYVKNELMYANNPIFQ